MRNVIILLLLISCKDLSAQNKTDVNRIVLNAFVFDKEDKMPSESKNLLKTKLEQIATNSGVGGNSINPRFIIAAKVNITSKDFISGPPQMNAINTDITLFVGDAIDNQLFSTETISVKGVGTNENKALINAIQQIPVKNKLFEEMVSKGKQKIIEYYEQKCDFIQTKSKTLTDQQKYDEAIYELMQVPEVSKSCYEKSMSAVQPVIRLKIDREGVLNLNKAKSIWAANQNRKGAEEVAGILSSIEPSASSYNEALSLSETIKKKIEEDEKRNWDFKMKKYNDGIKLEQQRIEAAKQIAISYSENQPETIIYNRIIW